MNKIDDDYLLDMTQKRSTMFIKHIYKVFYCK